MLHITVALVALILVGGLGYLAYLYGHIPGTYRASLRGLANKSRAIKIASAKQLGKFKNPEAIGPLIKVLKVPDPILRKACIEALGNIGKPAIEPLCQTFIHNDEELRFAAIEALYSINPVDSLGPLAKRMVTAPVYIRRYVAEVLVKIGHESLEPLMKAAPDLLPEGAAADGDLAVREQFVELLTRIGKDNPDVLFEAPAFHDKQRLYVAQALGRLGDPRAPGLLTRLLASRNPHLQAKAARALKGIGEPAVDPVMELLLANNETARDTAIELLVAIGGKGHQALLELVDAAEPEVRLQAAIALGRQGIVRPLIGVLWPSSRQEVAASIENGSKTKIESLANLTSLRKAAEEALYFGKMGKKYRALYYLQSLLIVLFPAEMTMVDDPRLGRILAHGGNVVDNAGFLRLTHLHPLARKVLESRKRTSKGSDNLKAPQQDPKPAALAKRSGN